MSFVISAYFEEKYVQLYPSPHYHGFATKQDVYLPLLRCEVYVGHLDQRIYKYYTGDCLLIIKTIVNLHAPMYKK